MNAPCRVRDAAAGRGDEPRARDACLTRANRQLERERARADVAYLGEEVLAGCGMNGESVVQRAIVNDDDLSVRRLNIGEIEAGVPQPWKGGYREITADRDRRIEDMHRRRQLD